MTRRTLARPAELEGVGLHTGARVRLRVEPAAPGSGIRFRRVDLQPVVTIPAHPDSVTAVDRRTGLEAGGARIETVEHLLAAVHALGIDDLTAEVTGPELPILDGSFEPFVSLLDEGGLAEQAGEAATWRVTRGFELTEAGASYRVEPAPALRVEIGLEYVEPVIGRQRARWDGTPAGFRREIAAARTYGFLAEVGPLRDAGLLRGASAGAALVLQDTEVLNGPLHWPDEFARHKLGDLVGDLALLGARLEAAITAERPSHRGNLACARAIARAARQPEG